MPLWCLSPWRNVPPLLFEWHWPLTIRGSKLTSNLDAHSSTIPLKRRISWSGCRSSITTRPSKLLVDVILPSLAHSSTNTVVLLMPHVVIADCNVGPLYPFIDHSTSLGDCPPLHVVRRKPTATTATGQTRPHWVQ